MHEHTAFPPPGLGTVIFVLCANNTWYLLGETQVHTHTHTFDEGSKERVLLLRLHFTHYNHLENKPVIGLGGIRPLC